MIIPDNVCFKMLITTELFVSIGSISLLRFLSEIKETAQSRADDIVNCSQKFNFRGTAGEKIKNHKIKAVIMEKVNDDVFTLLIIVKFTVLKTFVSVSLFCFNC